jgi:hypothetical protein
VPGVEAAPGGALEPVEGAEIETQTFVRGGVEIHVHRVTAPAGWTVREGGYPVAGPDRLVRGENEKLPGAFAVNDLGVVSRIENLGGFTATGVADELGANALGAFSATPYLTAEHPGGTAFYRSKVMLYRLPEEEADEEEAGGEAAGGEAAP